METKKCDFCENDIDAVKYRLHSIQCARLNYKCFECGLIVLKAEKEEHDAEMCGKQSIVDDVQVADKTAPQSDEESKVPEAAEINDDVFIPELKKMTSAEVEEANEREIQRIMQEEMQLQDAQMLQEEENMQDAGMPMTNYERSKLETAQKRAKYGFDSSQWPEGVRPADNNVEQQLIGGDSSMFLDTDHQDYEGNLFNLADGEQSINKPAVNHTAQIGIPARMAAKREAQALESVKWQIPMVPQAKAKPIERVPPQIGEDPDEQANFQAQSETEALEAQMLEQILAESLKDFS